MDTFINEQAVIYLFHKTKATKTNKKAASAAFAFL
jgi:hypothetical protein